MTNATLRRGKEQREHAYRILASHRLHGRAPCHRRWYLLPNQGVVRTFEALAPCTRVFRKAPPWHYRAPQSLCYERPNLSKRKGQTHPAPPPIDAQGKGADGRVQMAGCRWQGADAKVQMAGCRWQSAVGRVQMAGCRWPGADGRVQMAGCRWQGANGRVQMAGCTWQGADGRVQMAECRWRGADGRVQMAGGYERPNL